MENKLKTTVAKHIAQIPTINQHLDKHSPEYVINRMKIENGIKAFIKPL